MWMPGGIHPICASKGTRTVEVNVRVDRAAANAIQQQFVAVSARSTHKPYFDFNHDDQGASFWPAGFTWKDSPQPGIYARGEWSKKGKEAIEGKEYRGFSPTFHIADEKADPAIVVANSRAKLNFGGLVNSPAFTTIEPLWSKDAKKVSPLWAKASESTVKSHKQFGKTQMTIEQIKKKIADARAEAEELRTKLAESDNETDKSNSQSELNAKENEIAMLELQAKNTELEAKAEASNQALLVQRTKDADGFIAVAVKRGALAPKDEAMKASWKTKLIEDPETFLPMLNAIPGIAAKSGGMIMPTSMVLRGGDVRISRADIGNVLREMTGINAKNQGADYMGKRAMAKDFASMYAKEILPRLREGDDIPLTANNPSQSVTTLASTIVSVRTLELLTLTFPMLQSITTDFSDQIVSYGDTLKTRTVGIPSVVSYNQTTGWSLAGGSTTDVSITYDHYRGVPITFDAQTLVSSVRRLFDEIAPAQAYALGKDMVDYVYTLITAGNFTATPIAAGTPTFGRSTIIDIGGALDDTANPDLGRTLLLNRPYYSAIAKDPTIIQLSAFQKADVITKGMEASSLQDVEGFRVIKAVNLPSTAIGGQTLKGFGYTKSALVIASRLSADYMNILPGAGNGTLTVITTPAGFSANQVQYVDNTFGSANQRLEFIYGASAGQAAAGQILTDV
jgi:phage I-like protein